MYAIEVLKKELKRLKDLEEEYTSRADIKNIERAIKILKENLVLDPDELKGNLWEDGTDSIF